MSRVFAQWAIEIWRSLDPLGETFWVYGCTRSGDPMTAPTLDMARAIAASHK
ncbi:hypothetical protein [Alkalicaulis satelles]|uniref:hypothetical protein n=1 Tax=Alkalicaulis satelles TaxID=2609175 RepID=UPI0018EC5DAD|nr:hypothetical protein [Alkalicaulis satelles]